MAITHTETIKRLEVLSSNNDNIIGRIVVTIDSSDDSNPSKYKFSSSETFEISTTGITTSTSGFIEYDNLTESTVKGWISADLSTSKQKGFNSSVINRHIEYDNRGTIDKTIPW